MKELHVGAIRHNNISKDEVKEHEKLKLSLLNVK